MTSTNIEEKAVKTGFQHQKFELLPIFISSSNFPNFKVIGHNDMLHDYYYLLYQLHWW